MPISRVVGHTLMVLSLIGFNAFAQVATGTYPNGAFDQYGVETINAGSLNDLILIPVISKPGRAGTNFSYALAYNSSIWTPSSVSGVTTWVPDSNWGWSGQTQALTGYLSYRTLNIPTCFIGSRRVHDTTLEGFVYHDAFGRATAFSGEIVSGGLCGDDSTTLPSTSNALTLTESLIILKANGDVISPPINTDVGSASYTDTNGNEITTSGSTIVDTLGTNALVISGGAPSPETFTYKDTGGSNQTVSISYSTYTVQTAFGCSGVSEFGPASENLVDKITFPDGTYYQFSYEPTPSASGNVTGRVASVQLPTGGSVSYSYADGANNINCSDGSAVNLSRSTSDGTTTYTRSSITSSTSQTTVQTPAGDHKTYKFVFDTASTTNPNQFLTTHQDAYDGPATGTPRADIAICYNGGTTSCDTTVPSFPLNELSVLSTLDGAVTNGTDTFLNSNGQATQVNQYDYGTSGRGGLLIQTANTYGYAGYFLTDSITYDSSSNVVSETHYAYDGSTPTSTSGLPQHIAVSGPRGNLTSVTLCASSACSGGASRVTNYAYDDAGSVLSVQNVPDSATSIQYDSGTDSYPTTITMPSTGVAHVTSSAYDLNTGLLTSSTDQNGNTISYTYDAMLRRLTIVYPAVAGSSTHAQTSYSYTAAVLTPSFSGAKVTADVLRVAGSNIETTSVLDGYGRTQQSILVDSAGNDTTYLTYDADGRLATKTNPERPSSSSTDGYTTYHYDALNRVISTLYPDGASSGTSVWTGNVDLLTDAAGNQRKLIYDGAGRLSTVWEPGPTGSFDYETDYSYLQNYSTSTYQTIVKQKGGSGSSGDWHTRTFTMDELGRLIGEQTPEAGTIQYSYLSYPSFTPCTGNVSAVCIRTDNEGTQTTYTYDALDRPTGKTYADTVSGVTVAANTPSVSYSYDQSSYNGLTISNGVGAMTGMSDGSGQTAWSFDTLGRATDVRKTINGYTKQSTLTYNYDSSVATMSDFGGTTLTYGYDNTGRPTSISDASGDYFANSASYYPPGLLASLANSISGGASYSRSNQYNNLLQPTVLTASRTSSPTATLMSYSYSYGTSGHNNGNVSSIQDNVNAGWNQQFSYDKLNRLSIASNPDSTHGTSWTQSFTYDPWGNLLSESQTGSISGYSPTATETNNQLSSMSYDSAGRVTGDVANTYSYDAEGRILTANSNTYVYDGVGNRVKTTISGTVTLYWPGVAGGIINESDSTASTMAKQVAFGGALVWRESAHGGSSVFLFQDHLGSTKVAADGSGTVKDNVSYYPYGGRISYSSVSSDNHYGFTGDQEDPDSDYAVFRNVNTIWGRFNRPDPYLGSYDFTNPQSLNRYAYVSNQPTIFTDTSGLQRPSLPKGPEDDGLGGGLAILSNQGGYSFGATWDEFGTITTVSSSAGTYSYNNATWNETMSGGYGGDVTGGPGGELICSDGTLCGMVWTSLTGMVLSQIPTGNVSSGPTTTPGFVATTPSTPPGFSKCKAWALAKGTFHVGLDVAGTIPFFGAPVDVVNFLSSEIPAVVTFGAAIATTDYSDPRGVALTYAGAGVALAAKSAVAGSKLSEAIPFVGIAVGIGTTAYDSHAAYSEYQACNTGG